MAGVSLRSAGLICVLALVWSAVFLIARAGFAPVSEAGHCGTPHTPGQPGYEDAYQPTTNQLDAAFVQASRDDLYPGAGSIWQLFNTEQGNRSNRGGGNPYVPPTLLKATGWVEASWAHADYDVPRGSSGPPLVSFDCGYGVMQFTSALGYDMNTGGDTSGAEKLIAIDYQRNIAAGSNVMIQKWNDAPAFRPIVGEGNPNLLEDWYYAIWSYNGFAAVNDPNSKPSTRGEYLCDGSQTRSNYPYQELVIGCMRNPPQGLWNGIPVSYRMSLPAFCGYGAGCNQANMDIPTPQPTHTDAGGGGGGGGGDEDPPFITQRKTLDRNRNGHIDAIRLTFNEVVNDDTSGFKVDVTGYCDSNAGTTKPPCTYVGGSADLEILVILPEKPQGDTDARPDVRVRSNTTVADLAGNLLGDEGSASKPGDGAGPAIIRAKTIGIETVQITLSEPVKANRVQKRDFKLVINSGVRELLRVFMPGDDTRYWRLKVIAEDDWSEDHVGFVRLKEPGVIVDLIGNKSMQVDLRPVKDGIP